MHLDPAACYRALQARDPRFDGVFFTAVRTTRIYCRPVCTARTPRASRCTFYATGAAAEKAGYRACLKCRPELAPGRAPVDAVSDLVRRAVAAIDAGALNERSVDELASSLGVTDRHLRRAMERELGVTPVELAQSRRIALAKQLLHDTDLDLAQIAFASGFASVRRFNALFRDRFGQPPSAVRRQLGSRAAGLVLVLDYRPPLDWAALLAFLAGRAIPGVEQVRDGVYARTVCLGAHRGRIQVAPHPRRAALSVSVSPGLEAALMPLATRVRALFDLDAAPLAVADHLGRDALLAPLLERHPGLRVPGAFDAFEMAVRALLGQQVSVRAATTLAGRLVQAFGDPLDDGAFAFPLPARLADAPVDAIARIGLPRQRAESLRALATACATGALDLDATPPARLKEELVELPGIGPWSAEYIAMRARHDPDAFPASDLGLRKALGGLTPARAAARARAWSPWRSYAVLHLWTRLSEGDRS